MTSHQAQADPDHTATAVDETFLRRVPITFYPDENNPNRPLLSTFLPRKRRGEDLGDTDGLSIDREKLTTLQTAAWNKRKQSTDNLARLTMPDIAAASCTVKPAPIADNPAHALIPELNSIDLASNSEAVKTMAKTLVDRCEIIEASDIASKD